MIYIIRHGQTDLNLEGKLQGHLGLPLNDHGIKQAELLKVQLQAIEFDAVFSSPQERAVRTAEIVTGKCVIIDSRIDVFDLGEADGLRRSETKMSHGVPDASVYKGVECPQNFVRRIFAFMKELEEKFDNNSNILICGHRCTTGCMGAFFEGIPKDENILAFSSDTGKYKTYEFKKE